MKNLILLCFLVFGGTVGINAQQTPAQPASTPNPAQDQQQIIRQRQELNRRFETLRRVEEMSRISVSDPAAFQVIKNIYRDPTKEELRLLEPHKEDLEKYAVFLRQKDTGVVKLLADTGCADNTQVVKVDCLKRSMPGSGSSYSFRTGNHRVPHLSDLTYINSNFQASGILSHAILVNLGDVPLEQISLQTKGLKFVTDFKAVTDFKKADEIDRQIISGIESEGFFYSRRAPALENTTYVLRSIAYEGKFHRAVNGIVYNEFDFDEREDVIIAFRIVRRDNESVTILWRQLAKQKTPALKKPGSESSKPKENKFAEEKQRI